MHKKLLKLQTRWTYAFAAAVMVKFFAYIMVRLISYIDGNSSILTVNNTIWAAADELFYVPICTGVAAVICWPRNTVRTRERMIFSGLATTLLALYLISLVTAIVFQSPFSFKEVAFMPFIITLFVSVFTFGLPYLLAAFIALAFVDSKTNDRAK